MKTHFYDIESLSNVFTLCNYKPDEDHIDIFYLCDDPALITYTDPSLTFKQAVLRRIYECNDNFRGSIELYDLRFKSSNDYLACTFGLSDAAGLVNNPNAASSYPDTFRPVCDTDPDYDPDIHPYLLGYNSYNYDTTMLALYFYEAYESVIDNDVMTTHFRPVSAKLMREYNDELFLPEFINSMPGRLARNYNIRTSSWSAPDYSDTKWKIRKSMLMSGRHLDVAKLNEKQQKLALKRICGMLGLQIMESDKLGPNDNTIKTKKQFLDLLAYNVSDVRNLKSVFDHRAYKAQFELKKGLLQTYPELIYEKQRDNYAPDKRPECVRRDRLTIDCSSARFASMALCPYGRLHDIPAVSFMYPSETKAKELGIPRVNVLEEAKKFFYKNFSQPELRTQFDRIYNYYKSIEGKNFNSSDGYLQDYPGANVYNINAIPKTNLCMPYFDKDGNPTSCFVTFSTGGIHGAEYNLPLYKADLAAYNKAVDDMAFVQSVYPDPVDLKKAKHILMPDFSVRPAKDFLKSGSTLKSASYKDLSDKAPVLFKEEKKGSYKINPKYVFTSADPTNHEDFTSYYPNMLIMLSAFWNEGLGYDRYAEIFDNKQKYGKLMKDKSAPVSEREMYSTLREGTKLILNSASGAGDANFDTSIRMNNMIISMRIIGQLFTWRIGQAQTVQGARVTSTNTDGLFTVLEASRNNEILKRESADINVEIEPEPTYLITKDSNNRIEMDTDTGEIQAASGGTLGCRKGPNPTKALAHPAIIDWALAEYLIVSALKTKPNISLSDKFDNETGRNILKAALNKFSPVDGLVMFQNIIASSAGSVNYIFGTTDENPSDPIILQHYNRMFIMKDKTPNTIHLWAANAKVLTPAMKSKRQRNHEAMQQHDPLAINVLELNGVSKNSISIDKEAVVKKVTNIESEWYILIVNKDLHELPDDKIQFIYDNLDYDKYLTLLKNCFTDNWKNEIPSAPEEKPELTPEEKAELLQTYSMQPKPLTSCFSLA